MLMLFSITTELSEQSATSNIFVMKIIL